MKKKFLPLLFVAALGMSVTSCTEVLEANVNNTHTFTVDFTKLVEAVNNMSNTLDNRIAALNELLNQKLADITLAINENTGAITAQTTALQGSLDSVRVTLFDGFTALCTKVTENGDKIVIAINSNGELISAKLDKTNKLIETTGGLYTDSEGKTDRLYMTPAAYNQLIAAGEDSEAYKTLMNSLTMKEPTIHACQATDASGGTHDHYTFEITSQTGSKLVAGNLGVHENSGTTASTYEVTRVPQSISYKGYLNYSGCGNANMYGYAVKDANGIHYYPASGTEVTGIALNSAESGTIVDDIYVIVYCFNFDSANFNEAEFTKYFK